MKIKNRSAFVLPLSAFLALAVATSVPVLGQTIIYDDGNFSDFPTGWTVSSPAGTSATVATNVPAGSGNTNSLHLVDSSTTELLAARANFSSIYTGSDMVTISYTFSTLNVMGGDPLVAQYSSSLVRLLSGEGAGALSLQVSKSPGGSSTARQSWGSGNGNAAENIYLDPGSWYQVVITAPGAGQTGNFSTTISGLNGAQVYGYNAPYTPSTSFSFSKAVSSIANYGALEFSSNYGVNPVQDIYYTDISVTAVPEPSVAVALGLAAFGFMAIRGFRRVRGASSLGVLAVVSLFGLMLSAQAGEKEYIYSDRDFVSFPDGDGDTCAWTIRATGDSTVTIVEEASPDGENGKSLRLFDPDEAVSMNPLNAFVITDGLAGTGDDAVEISFDFRMTNPEANSNLLFRVYPGDENARDFAGAIQFFNNWKGENGGIQLGNQSGSNGGRLEFDRWYRVTVKLPPPGVEGTQSFLVTDIENPQVFYSFSEKVPTVLNEYARLSFSSGFGDERRLDALVTNIRARKATAN